MIPLDSTENTYRHLNLSGMQYINLCLYVSVFYIPWDFISGIIYSGTYIAADITPFDDGATEEISHAQHWEIYIVQHIRSCTTLVTKHFVISEG